MNRPKVVLFTLYRIRASGVGLPQKSKGGFAEENEDELPQQGENGLPHKKEVDLQLTAE